MHRSGVIPCRWPWKLLERSGSSSLGGPEKVATVKVTSIPPLYLSFVFFSLFPNVSNRLCIRARVTHVCTNVHTTKLQRVPAALLAREQPKLAVAFWYMCTRPKVSPDRARNENETENADLKSLPTVVFEKT